MPPASTSWNGCNMLSCLTTAWTVVTRSDMPSCKMWCATWSPSCAQATTAGASAAMRAQPASAYTHLLTHSAPDLYFSSCTGGTPFCFASKCMTYSGMHRNPFGCILYNCKLSARLWQGTHILCKMMKPGVADDLRQTYLPCGC